MRDNVHSTLSANAIASTGGGHRKSGGQKTLHERCPMIQKKAYIFLGEMNIWHEITAPEGLSFGLGPVLWAVSRLGGNY
jgi:hypothetical protein